MAPRTQAFTQTEVVKLLKATAKAGKRVGRLEAEPNRIVLHFEQEGNNKQPPESAEDLL
ncbi:hypothetical protein ABIC03_003465 [Bradyrhizobium sp. RT6a]|uniref:hypothetical protein n=1 Tax=unclassified Bradyrhizobium TaxID=2631580 RepID=UPI0033921F96